MVVDAHTIFVVFKLCTLDSVRRTFYKLILKFYVNIFTQHN